MMALFSLADAGITRSGGWKVKLDASWLETGHKCVTLKLAVEFPPLVFVNPCGESLPQGA